MYMSSFNIFQHVKVAVVQLVGRLVGSLPGMHKRAPWRTGAVAAKVAASKAVAPKLKRLTLPYPGAQVLSRPESLPAAAPASGGAGSDQHLGFWRNPKRFNVAITRAKALLVCHTGHPAHAVFQCEAVPA